MVDFDNLKKKYGAQLEKQLGSSPQQVEKDAIAFAPPVSKNYKDFKEENLPKILGWYEKICAKCEKIFPIQPDAKKKEEIEESLYIAHIEATPTGVTSASFIIPIVFMVVCITLSLLLMGSMFFTMISVIVGVMLIGLFSKFPGYLANQWRLKASSQMVLAVFYVVTYIRHTSNLELAIEFAATHLSPPLSIDLKRVVWNLETERYESIKESLEEYLKSWRKWNLEFIESFHLIESSLYEPYEERRLNLIEKALRIMLEETYEKMLHYAQNLKSPITMLHMLGIIMPILGLVILPLLVNFIAGVKWFHIAVIYDILLPIGVYAVGLNILSTRPTGYGDSDISDLNPELKKYKKFIINLGFTEIKLSPFGISMLIIVIFVLIGMLPILLHLINPSFDIVFIEGVNLIGYRASKENPAVSVGPFGLGAAILSLFVVIGVGYGIGYYYSIRSKKLIELRKETKKLEQEFASALFQLGSRVGDGIPIEMAFGQVAEVINGTKSGEFFSIVDNNIRRLGMSVTDALFNEQNGAIKEFPSNIIKSSMKVLVESSRKGPIITSHTLMNISQYIKEMHRVDERLKDLLSDIISSMKSQVKFLAPTIAGIVVGITSMITTIIGQLSTSLGAISTGSGGGVGGNAMGSFFQGDGIPTFYFQIMVGLYIVSLVYILTKLGNSIENGNDPLGEEYFLGVNLMHSTILYAFIAGVVTILFNIIAIEIVGTTVTIG